jgi:hypothetical protein
MIYNYCDTQTLLNFIKLRYQVPNRILHPRLQIVPYFDLKKHIECHGTIIFKIYSTNLNYFGLGCLEFYV